MGLYESDARWHLGLSEHKNECQQQGCGNLATCKCDGQSLCNHHARQASYQKKTPYFIKEGVAIPDGKTWPLVLGGLYGR